MNKTIGMIIGFFLVIIICGVYGLTFTKVVIQDQTQTGTKAPFQGVTIGEIDDAMKAVEATRTFTLLSNITGKEQYTETWNVCTQEQRIYPKATSTTTTTIIKQTTTSRMGQVTTTINVDEGI